MWLVPTVALCEWYTWGALFGWYIQVNCVIGALRFIYCADGILGCIVCVVYYSVALYGWNTRGALCEWFTIGALCGWCPRGALCAYSTWCTCRD